MSQKIVMESIPASREADTCRELCTGEIPGASVLYHSVPKGSCAAFGEDTANWHILFFLEGDAEVTHGGKTWSIDDRAVFVPSPECSTEVYANSSLCFIEIIWKAEKNDMETVDPSKAKFPVFQPYWTAKQYRDPFKTEKTISRALIEQRVVPRFAMGSVETYGYDIMYPHAHPLLDQFFFTFPECDMDLLLDTDHIHIGGNTLLHIPLGSSHGAEVDTPQRHMHYLWIDFIQSQEGVELLDRDHRATGRMDSF